MILSSFVVLHGMIIILSFNVYMSNALIPIQHCLKSMTNPEMFKSRDTRVTDWIGGNGLTGFSEANTPNFATLVGTVLIFRKVGRIARFPLYLRNYRQLQILNGVQNRLSQYALPLWLMTSLAVSSILGYMVVKMSPKVPIIFKIFGAGAFLGIIFAAHSAFPMATNVTAKSKNFIRYWKNQELPVSYRKEVISCKVLRIEIGPFFYLKKSSRILFMSHLLYYTVTLVISV
ncbi:hypothetical protein Fcan01_10118 [Folsomia candida]|uniref:Uncharacterized protein n=1 Tax=Folsomia candida TaxID=158441 RepID=A0A226EB44_FOLCA|nr:hypothetical protein Fcan01_10118 [Folsomia candida]